MRLKTTTTHWITVVVSGFVQIEYLKISCLHSIITAKHCINGAIRFENLMLQISNTNK